jgi:2-succinyl-6-hydroxy-2,4-cyclohexadiene-1-carboxylate synthase
MRIHALHGLLGGQTDWRLLAESLMSHYQIESYDLLAEELSVGLDSWGKAFNAHAKLALDAQNLLVGYSLGGRLALHALCAEPDLWTGAVIVSAHPGLSDDASKNGRLLSDEAWAARFENEPWSQWIGDWNSQPVFRHDPPHHEVPLAAEKCRLYARALRRWSLGAQHDLLPELARVETPVLWVVGEKDEGFLKIGEKVRFKHPLSRVVIIEGAGHRLPWSQPETFNREVEQFIKSVEERRCHS